MENPGPGVQGAFVPAAWAPGLPWALVCGILSGAGHAAGTAPGCSQCGRALSSVRHLVLQLTGGWHHCLSPARKRCLVTEDSITCELIKQAAACKPAASAPRMFTCAPGRCPGGGTGVARGWGECRSRALWLCGTALWFHVEWGQGSHNVRRSPPGAEAAWGPGRGCAGGALRGGFGMFGARAGSGYQGR